MKIYQNKFLLINNKVINPQVIYTSRLFNPFLYSNNDDDLSINISGTEIYCGKLYISRDI